MSATPEEVSALHVTSTTTSPGRSTWGVRDWYLDVSEAADERRMEIVSTLKGRRCATAFEMGTAVPTTVWTRPSSRRARWTTGREPWRFKVLGEDSGGGLRGHALGSELGTDGPVARGAWW